MIPEPGPGISAIVLTRNGASHLEKLLRTFAAANTYAPLELLIVDHSSTDHTRAVLERFRGRLPLRVLARDRNYSFAASCNWAAARAAHPLLLFLNDDIVFCRDVLPLAAAQLEDERIGAVGVRLDDDPEALPPGQQPAVQHVGIRFAWDPEHRFYRPYQLRLRSVEEAAAVPSGLYPAVTGAFLLCRAEDFRALGGFHEGYDYGFEDVDFCIQLRVRLGKRCLCVNEVSLRHLEGATRKREETGLRKERERRNADLLRRRADPSFFREPHVLPPRAPAKTRAAGTAGTAPTPPPPPAPAAPPPAPQPHAPPGPARLTLGPREQEDRRLIEQAGLFDPDWYGGAYPDIVHKGLDLLDHYVKFGSREGRRPRDDFDSGWYLGAYPDVAEAGLNPLVHYIRFGRAEGRRTQAAPPERAEAVPVPETVDGVEVYPGRLPLLQDAPNILFVAHEAGSTLFGSERYFMEIVACAARLCVNCLACLPARQTAMIGRLLPHTSRVFVFPYPTWNSRRAEDGAVIDRFARLMDDHRVHLVNANTIMLREPLTAARQCGVLRSVNAHEIIQHDPYLMEAIGLDGPQIIGQVRRCADYLIANSRATAETYGMGDRSFVVHNPVDGDALNIPNALDGPVRVAMISSNIPKKGLGDFVRLAERCRVRAPSARFVLVGPHNRHVEEILRRKRSGEVGANLEYAGYAEHPVDAVRAGNIVVNLSHFAESFGRTVLEAMAARRAVVAYRWGALPELVEEGETGHLVPYQDVEAAAAVIERLCRQPEEILRLGENGRAKAVAGYGFEALFDVLRRAYGVMLQRTLEARRPRAGGACARPAATPARRDAGGAARALAGAYSVIVPSYNYEGYIEERLESVLAQTCPPREILFLDDASTDRSVLVAEKVLSRSGIPYRIRINPENQGVYRQWARGIREASAPFVWIAEADDTADPRFAEHLAEIAECDDVALAYAQSRQVDDLGAVLCERNTHHTDDLDPDRWNRDYTENGLREVVDYLCYRNSIPNASACLFRKAFAEDALDRLERFRYCGDWMLYAHLLGRGRVVFRGAPLNGFRRHGRTVTQSRGRSEGYLLELLEVHRFIAERFPIHRRQVDRILAFLDKDYAVEGVPKNSEHPAVRVGFASLRALAEPRRRLAFVTTNDGSPVGGSEVLWAEAVKRLRGAGHDVVVLIKRWEPEPPLLQEFRALGVRPYFKEEEGFEAVEWFRPDLVVFSLGDQDEGTEFYARCRRAGLPYVIVNQLAKEARVWPIREHLQPAVREGYLAARKLFFTCRNNHDVMERRLGCALPHYGVHYNPFHMERDVRLPFPPLDDGLQVAVPARYLFIHKGQDLLIELMRRDAWRSRRLTLNFYGEGPDEPAIRERIEAFGIRNIRLHGWQKSMLDIWRDNHGILMPSHMEGMPIVLVGAMLCARVPIVTRVGGHEEVIDDDRTGFLARAATVEDLDDALGRAYRRREEWEEIGARARQAILAYLPEDPVGDFVSKLLALA